MINRQSAHQQDATSSAAPTAAQRKVNRRLWPRLTLGLLLIAGLAWSGLALYWSRQPPVADVSALLAQRISASSAASKDAGSGRASEQAAPGNAFVATTIFVADTLLQKPGGFLHNDRLPPGALMDNMPSWECGVLMALRDAVQALRNDFTRAQSQSREELNVKRADLQFAIDPKSWLMPAAEDEYRKGLQALELYFNDLAGGRTGAAEHFFPRADNLAAYLALVEKRLGNFGVRLGESVADAGLANASPSGTVAASAEPPAPSNAREPGIDNVFYCARGYSWALLHFMRAIKIDFVSVLASKNATVAVQQVTRDLEGAVKRMRSPMVLNGRGFGLMANHSLVIASYVSRVNAAIIDLKLLLLQG